MTLMMMKNLQTKGTGEVKTKTKYLYITKVIFRQPRVGFFEITTELYLILK